MKANNDPLPISNNKRVKYRYGKYIKVRCCAVCQEFEIETIHSVMIDCCPNCGNEFYENIIGRHKFKLRKVWFSPFSRFETEIIGFAPKEKNWYDLTS